MRHVDGNIPDDSNVALGRVFAQGLPLLGEFKLPVLNGFDFRVKPGSPGAKGFGLSSRDVGGPMRPRGKILCVFYRHKECKVIEPVGIGLAEVFEPPGGREQGRT